jgi:lactate permease
MSGKPIKIFVFLFLPLLVLLIVNQLTQNSIGFIQTILAAAPILIVLVVMIVFHVGGQVAGPIGLLSGLLVAFQAFGLTSNILVISQVKGLLLSLFVLAVFLPALFLYNIVNQAGGIQSIALALENRIQDRGILLIVIAWAFSGMLEGLAGFGLPVAIVSPMLVELGLSPILAVAAVAIGHAWSVTFGDMGVIYQTLISVVKVVPVQLSMVAAIFLGISCLACGLAVAHLLKRLNKWPIVLVLALVMAVVQYAFVMLNIAALASFCAGLAGVSAAVLINNILMKFKNEKSAPMEWTLPLKMALLSYGSLTVLMSLIAIVTPIHQALGKFSWYVAYPEVTTLRGFTTAAVINQHYYPLLHPGTSILLIALISYFLNKRAKLYSSTNLWHIVSITEKAALPPAIGILSMVGLSALMDHSGMTNQLAELLSSFFKAAFPLVSPYIGMLGAFATGSNNNSNVLFAPLQEGIAILLKISPAVIVAAQTTGGALGSMIAPAKVIVGCSTVAAQGSDGEVLRKTIPYGLVIGLVMGIITMIFAIMY